MMMFLFTVLFGSVWSSFLFFTNANTEYLSLSLSLSLSVSVSLSTNTHIHTHTHTHTCTHSCFEYLAGDPSLMCALLILFMAWQFCRGNEHQIKTFLCHSFEPYANVGEFMDYGNSKSFKYQTNTANTMPRKKLPPQSNTKHYMCVSKSTK